MQKNKKKTSSLGGLEPPTFRLTVERANRLRHRDFHIGHCVYFSKQSCLTLTSAMNDFTKKICTRVIFSIRLELELYFENKELL